MKNQQNNPLFKIFPDSDVPKFQQIVDGVIEAIRSGRARRGDALPSVGYICRRFGVARETVIKAYRELKSMGVVNAVSRKGYFVATESVLHTMKVLLLFDEFSPYKQDLYDAFRVKIAGRVTFDIFFHHCDIRAFQSLLLDRADYYNLCVVMPFEDSRILAILKKVEPSKLLILDRGEHSEGYSFVGQDHDQSLFEALQSGCDLFEKYAKINLVFPKPGSPALHSSQAPSVIPGAFKRFCRKNGFKYSVVGKVSDVKRGEACFVIDDADLVDVVEKARAKKWKLGRDIGLLAYNETDMRRVVGDGITVVSTDFREMGRLAAEFVLKPERSRQIVPVELIRRKSL